MLQRNSPLPSLSPGNTHEASLPPRCFFSLQLCFSYALYSGISADGQPEDGVGERGRRGGGMCKEPLSRVTLASFRRQSTEFFLTWVKPEKGCSEIPTFLFLVTTGLPSILLLLFAHTHSFDSHSAELFTSGRGICYLQ